MTAYEDALAFIRNEASTEDIEGIHAAIAVARARLKRQMQNALHVGSKVKTVNLSPKYLNGLTGEVTELHGSRVEILLDMPSTNAIRGTKFGPHSSLPVDLPAPLRGVPVSALALA